MEKSLFRRIRRVFFLWLFNLFFANITRFWGIKRLVLKWACINCGDKTRVLGPLRVGNSVHLSFGNDVWVGQDFTVYGSGKCIIGDRCDIGPGVAILSGSHAIGGSERRAGKGCHYTTKIGSGVWIGGRSTIYGDITIADSSIIAAGAVVNKNVSENTIVGGVPAKILRSL